MLIGCKSDLAERRQVSTQEGLAYAAELGVPYAECSSKTGEGVNHVAALLVREVMARRVRARGVARAEEDAKRQQANSGDSCIVQ